VFGKPHFHFTLYSLPSGHSASIGNPGRGRRKLVRWALTETVQEIAVTGQFQEEDEEIRGRIYGRWVLEWMTLLQGRIATEAKGSKCQFVLLFYVIFVVEYGFVTQFLKGNIHC